MFLYQFNIHVGPILEVFPACVSATDGLILLSLSSEVVFCREKHSVEAVFENFKPLWERHESNNCTFIITLTFVTPWNQQKLKKFMLQEQHIELLKYIKAKTLFRFSQLLFALIGHFWIVIRKTSSVKGSKSKFILPFHFEISLIG